MILTKMSIYHDPLSRYVFSMWSNLAFVQRHLVKFGKFLSLDAFIAF